jgi:hypothetical protein
MKLEQLRCEKQKKRKKKKGKKNTKLDIKKQYKLG